SRQRREGIDCTGPSVSLGKSLGCVSVLEPSTERGMSIGCLLSIPPGDIFSRRRHTFRKERFRQGSLYGLRWSSTHRNPPDRFGFEQAFSSILRNSIAL